MVIKSVERGVATLVGIMLLTGSLSYSVGCWNMQRVHTLSSGACHIQFKYHIDVDSLDEGYQLANRKLAHCLCRLYKAGSADVDTARLINLYQKFGMPLSYLQISASNKYLLDTLIKRRHMIFDTSAAIIR